MKKWTVTGAVGGSKHLGVFEAETGEDAIAMADEDASVSLCHQCNDECEDPEIQFMIAACGEEVVSSEETWQERALAAGWTPPKAKKGKAK